MKILPCLFLLVLVGCSVPEDNYKMFVSTNRGPAYLYGSPMSKTECLNISNIFNNHFPDTNAVCIDEAYLSTR